MLAPQFRIYPRLSVDDDDESGVHLASANDMPVDSPARLLIERAVRSVEEPEFRYPGRIRLAVIVGIPAAFWAIMLAIWVVW
jgi:hypothetical protein